MKKSLLILFLAFVGPKLGWTKIVPESTTVTAQDTSSVNIPANVPWGVGADGKDHRLAVDNTGALKVAASGSGALTITSATQLSPTGMTAYSVLSQTATVLQLTALNMVCLSGNGVGVGTGFRVQTGWSATAPVNLTSPAGNGPVGAPVTNLERCQCFGPLSANSYIYLAANAASTTAQVDVYNVK